MSTLLFVILVNSVVIAWFALKLKDRTLAIKRAAYDFEEMAQALQLLQQRPDLPSNMYGALSTLVMSAQVFRNSAERAIK